MQKSDNTLIYSVFSGTYYEIPTKDFKLLDVGQLPLTKKPSSTCSKCHGRGHTGRDTQTFGYSICSCIRKAINHDIIRHAENITIG
jgi:hypothetical protein